MAHTLLFRHSYSFGLRFLPKRLSKKEVEWSPEVMKICFRNGQRPFAPEQINISFLA